MASNLKSNMIMVLRIFLTPFIIVWFGGVWLYSVYKNYEVIIDFVERDDDYHPPSNIA